MQTLKTNYGQGWETHQITELSLGVVFLQVAGGNWRTASPVRPDFCMLPLLSESPAKWGR